MWTQYKTLSHLHSYIPTPTQPPPLPSSFYQLTQTQTTQTYTNNVDVYPSPTSLPPLREAYSLERGHRTRICKRLRRPGIDSEDSLLPAYVAWRAGTTNSVVVPACQAGNRFLGSIKRFTNTSSEKEKTWAGNCREKDSCIQKDNQWRVEVRPSKPQTKINSGFDPAGTWRV
jgi:hypothetical protein